MQPGLRGQLMVGVLGGGLLVFSAVFVLVVGLSEAGRALAHRSIAEAEAEALAAAVQAAEGEEVCGVAARLGLDGRVVVGAQQGRRCVEEASGGRSGGVPVPGVEEAWVEVPSDRLPVQWSALRRAIPWYLSLLLGLVLVVSWLVLTRWLVMPLRRLAVAMQRVSEGRADERVPLTGRGELASLARSFNMMLDHLGEARGALEERLADVERANAALRDARREVMRAEHLASVGRLSAGLAHELGNPLSAVRGMLDLVRTGEGIGEEDRDLLERARAELGRMEELLRGLLAYARPERGVEEEVMLEQVAREAVSLARHHSRASGVDLGVEVTASRVVALADPEGLRQVLLNLLINACDASSAGGQVRVVVDVEEDGRPELRVVDEGSGMTAEVRASAFEPFFTTKAPGEGTGLGLALSERMVVEMGGGIELASREGEGTVVKLVLRGPDGGAQDSSIPSGK